MAKTSAEIRQDVTDRIIKALEGGVKPWARPWSLDPNAGAPTSFATKKTYNGVNPILLSLASMEKEYVGKYWATFEQWRKQGARVNAGEKATWITYYGQHVRKAKSEDEEDTKYAILKMFAVFNIDQVHGDSVDKFRPDVNATNEGTADYSMADTTVKATGAKVTHGGNRAFYHPTTKAIKVPYKSKFQDEESYYSTLFHELSHWADHAIGSKMGKRFGDDDYAFGELVAEMGACYLSEACGIPKGKRWDDSVSYLDGWIKNMKGDNTYIFKAATRASQVTEYVLNFSREPEPEVAEV